MDIAQTLAQEFSLRPEHVCNIIQLWDEGNTIPFIARYRKEMTGSCDDQVLRELAERLQYLRNLLQRKEEVEVSIANQDKLTPALAQAIQDAATLTEVEDLYRPFRPKRRTRATIAQEKGLAPLADLLWAQDPAAPSVAELAQPFVEEEKGVATWEEAVAGAQDILAERISDDAACRKELRQMLEKEALLRTVGDGEKDSVYEMYYDYSEPVAKVPSHRILAIDRGEREGFLKVHVEMEEGAVLAKLWAAFVRPGSSASETVQAAATDGWRRLIQPSLEREIRRQLTEKAAEQAIDMFALNLRPLLLQPPVKGKVALGFDPAYRTGCKIAVVDGTGKLLAHTVVYPTPPQNKTAEAKTKLKELIHRYGVEVIAIGNGTASKESEVFVAELIAELDRKVSYMVVNEAGASVYSASKLGAEEFPQLDVSIRSAVSIARRLQDPLAELVKIDPKSIGVGQYQHDMPPARLDDALSGVVEDCVNQVGVDLNTASPALLTYIAGLNATIAKNVVAFREENGPFTSRKQLQQVPRLGAKTFQQCAGFLRIPEAPNVLDNTAVHPESYAGAQALLELCGLCLEDVAGNQMRLLPRKVQEQGWEQVARACGLGVPTLRDMVKELLQPGRDLRDELPPPLLRTDVMALEDLYPGMTLKGTVRNVVDFGAFVDIGVHQDGLVHISQLADRFVQHPSEVVQVGDVVQVYVLEVDVARKRISLSLRGPAGQQNQPA